jgi:hypothetical protein
MIFQEGNTYVLQIPLTVNGEDIDINNVSIVEFMFENIRKIYGTYIEGNEEIAGDVTYNSEEKCFEVPLSQEETFSLTENGIIKYQARVKFTDNSVSGTCVYNGYVSESISKEVL